MVRYLDPANIDIRKVSFPNNKRGETISNRVSSMFLQSLTSAKPSQQNKVEPPFRSSV